MLTISITTLKKAWYVPVLLVLASSLYGLPVHAQIVPHCEPVETQTECFAIANKICKESCNRPDRPPDIACIEACIEKYHCADKGTEKCDLNHLLQLFVNIYNVLLGLASFIAMLFIVWAGVRMFYWSTFEDSEGELGSAKKTLTRAITGLVIIAIAWLIVNTTIVVLGGGGINTILENAGLIKK